MNKKSTRGKRKSSSKATILPVTPPMWRSKSKNGNIDSVRGWIAMYSLSNYVFVQPYSQTKQQWRDRKIHCKNTIS
jgi:hypothetical protein